MSITILGLGPGDPQALTQEARNTLAHAREIFLRTREHPTVSALPKHLRVHSYDHLYEQLSDFNAIYSAIAQDVLARGRQRDVLYGVPGHPLYGEISVLEILTLGREQNIPVRIIGGISFVDAACAALALDPLARGLQVADATELAQQHFPPFNADRPVLVGQLYNRAVAGDCKLTLLVLYPPEHAVTLVDAAGTAKQKIWSLPLAELDHGEHWDRGPSPAFLLRTLYVPPLPRPSSFEALGEIIAHLRAPEGCAWDRQQTHQSLRASLLEEAYEVLEALDEDDMPHLREELGDLLLNICLQTQIASEAGEFSMSEVIAEIAAKLVRRHPHVFGNIEVSGTGEIVANWEKIKQSEKGNKPETKLSIPRGLPALTMATKAARKAQVHAGVGEIAAQVRKLKRSRNKGQVLGDILFALAAYASTHALDAESELRSVARKGIQPKPPANKGRKRATRRARSKD